MAEEVSRAEDIRAVKEFTLNLKENTVLREEKSASKAKVMVPTLETMLYNIESANNYPLKALHYLKKLYIQTELV